MNNDVKQIINQWKVSQSDIKMDTADATVFRFYILMPHPKGKMGMTVAFNYYQSDFYDVYFFTDDIVRRNARNQAIIDELISKTAGKIKRLELDSDGDLRYKTAIPKVKNGEGYSLFNGAVLSIVEDCKDLYALLS